MPVFYDKIGINIRDKVRVKMNTKMYIVLYAALHCVTKRRFSVHRRINNEHSGGNAPLLTP